MSAFRRRSAITAIALLAVLAAAGAPARASGPTPEPEPAAPDTTLHRFLGTLSDSTDRYFGMSAAPLDTAGLGGEMSFPSEARRRFSPALTPSFDFNRADGSTFGGGLKLQGPIRYGRLDLRASYAVSAEQWLGGARYRRRVIRHGVNWTIDARGGRETVGLNRDHTEPFLDPARALVFECPENDLPARRVGDEVPHELGHGRRDAGGIGGRQADADRELAPSVSSGQGVGFVGDRQQRLTPDARGLHPRTE